MASRLGKPPAQPRPHIRALTGLRAFAAAGVFIHHFYRHWHPAPGALSDFLESGSLGVSIFFALSGFLITRVYLPEVLAGKFDFRRYWFKRAARILPVYWVILTVALMLQRDSFSNWAALLPNYTLTQTLWSSTIWSGIFTAWSLTSEETFYLLAPCVLLLLVAGGRAAFGLRRGLIILAGASVGLYATGMLLARTNAGSDLLSFPPYIFHFNIFGRFPDFAVGVFAALFLAIPSGARKNSRPAAWLPELGTVTFLAVTALAMYLWMHLEKDIAPRRALFPIESCLIFWLTAAGTAIFLMSAASGSRLATAVFGNPVVVYLGRISYCLYLLQNSVFIDAVSGALTRIGLDPAQPFVLYAGLSVLAALFYHLVESPLHAGVTKFLRSKNHAPVRKLDRIKARPKSSRTAFQPARKRAV